MELFPTREILFQGSNDRLHRTVNREGGVFPENQQFKILWKSKRVKPLGRLSFWFVCYYEKIDKAYQITYRVRPSFSTLCTTVLSLLIVGLFFYRASVQNLTELIPCLFVLLIASIGTFFYQCNQCIDEFRKTFTVITSARNK